jgi:hypothetical protein
MAAEPMEDTMAARSGVDVSGLLRKLLAALDDDPRSDDAGLATG